MCGIAGFCNFPDPKGDGENLKVNIERMKKRMFHRGPDAGGSWISEDGKVVFGHRRLSIVDLSETGAQPMTSKSGRFVICYNGEIYNHKKLAEKLLAEGKVTSFKGTSDTEVLLHAYLEYGDSTHSRGIVGRHFLICCRSIDAGSDEQSSSGPLQYRYILRCRIWCNCGTCYGFDN